MRILHKIKRLIKKVIYQEKVNYVMRSLLRPLMRTGLREMIKDIFPVVGTVCLRLPNTKKLYLRTSGNDIIAANLFWEGIKGFEGETLNLLGKILGYLNVIFDVGANVGVYSLFSAIDNPQNRIYSFEPVPEIFNRLQDNMAVNKLTNLNAIPAAVTSHDGKTVLYIPASSAIPTEASTLQSFRKCCKEIEVPAITLDSFVAKTGIPRVDLIKIDTDGTEHSVLQGAKNILTRDEPVIICEVLRGRTEHLLHSVLDSFQYQYFWITPSGLIEKKQIEGDGNSGYFNYLFITKNRLGTLGKAIGIN